MFTLLDRNMFRDSVFARDNSTCVVCSDPAQDAHHIMERRLFPDGGYYVENGVSVCGDCHLKSESTDISVDDLRRFAGITKVILPPHLYSDQVYDKWGNVILSNGMRMRGELFYDESVQKIIRKHLGLFVHLVKYPRTWHTPWSRCITEDDRVVPTMDIFAGKRVIITEKMDGENTSLYSDDTHARSVDSPTHSTRDWVKNHWSGFKYDIPVGWRVCGENLYARHSIEYNELESFFMGFSVWNDMNVCLPWDETLEWFELLGILPVPVLYDGIYDEEFTRNLENVLDFSRQEGYVIRVADGFPFGEFRNSLVKFVRKGHVSTVKHWFYGGQIENNQMRK